MFTKNSIGEQSPFSAGTENEHPVCRSVSPVVKNDWQRPLRPLNTLRMVGG